VKPEVEYHLKPNRTNSTFAIRTSLPTRQNCKRAIFFLTPLKIEITLLNLTIFGQVYYKSMTIGQKIRQLREESGMKQRELAAKLDIGEGFLSKVENDQKPLKREDLSKLSKLFNVKHSDLETLWLANKVYDLIKNEKQGLDALKVAEEQAKHVQND